MCGTFLFLLHHSRHVFRREDEDYVQTNGNNPILCCIVKIGDRLPSHITSVCRKTILHFLRNSCHPDRLRRTAREVLPSPGEIDL